MTSFFKHVVYGLVAYSEITYAYTPSTYAPTGTVPPVAPSQCPLDATALQKGEPGYKPGYHCADAGTTSEPGWLERFPAYEDYHSEFKCFDVCRKDLKCVSFAYNQTNNICRTFNTTVRARGFERRERGDTKYWNIRGCYECLRTNAKNEAFNGDFDLAIPGLNGSPLLFPGWTAGYETGLTITPGTYGPETGVMGQSAADPTKPLGVNNFVQVGIPEMRSARANAEHFRQMSVSDEYSSPAIISDPIHDLNISSWYIITYVYYFKYFVDPGNGGGGDAVFCRLNTLLSEGVNGGPSNSAYPGYDFTSPDFRVNDIWHDEAWAGMPSSSTQQLKIIVHCPANATIFLDKISLQEYPYQPSL